MAIRICWPAEDILCGHCGLSRPRRSERNAERQPATGASPKTRRSHALSHYRILPLDASISVRASLSLFLLVVGPRRQAVRTLATRVPVPPLGELSGSGIDVRRTVAYSPLYYPRLFPSYSGSPRRTFCVEEGTMCLGVQRILRSTRRPS